MNKKIIDINGIKCGSNQLFLISGPCVIEEEMMMMKTAEKLAQISQKINIPIIFKSSFTKDNRSSLQYYTGPGIDKGLKILEKIKNEFQLPIISDIHYPSQAKQAGEVLDIIQIPAYLCMQSELLVAAAKTNKPINIKHGQFLAPENMSKPAQKCVDTGNDNIILTERGHAFGYNDLVVDPRSLYIMKQTGYPIVFDATHSIRKYGIPSVDPSGGNKEYLPTLARAGTAAGIDGLFIEVHPNPTEAKCDAASQLSLHLLEDFLKPLIELHNIEVKYRNNKNTI